jgi:DNA-directed RNA polymerase subunit M/transcription elongation factor TFIIS
MSTTKLDLQTQASATQTIPLLVPAEAKTNHPINQPAALTEENRVHRSIQPPNRNLEKQKQLLSFCPTCKMLLRAVENRPYLLKCKKCGYRAEPEHKPLIDGKHSHRSVNEIAVIDEEKANLRTHSIVQALCEKCGKTESETWTIAVGSEGTTSALTFLRCTQCGFTRREVG